MNFNSYYMERNPLYASREKVISMAARLVAVVFALRAGFEIVTTLLNMRMWLLSWKDLKANPMILAYPAQTLAKTFFIVALSLYLLMSGRLAKKLLRQYTDLEPQVSLNKQNVILLAVRSMGVYTLLSFALYLLGFLSLIIRHAAVNYEVYHQTRGGIGSFLFEVIFIQNFHVTLIICPLNILLIYYLLNRGDSVMNFILNGHLKPPETPV